MTQITEPATTTDNGGEDVGSGLFAALASAQCGRLAVGPEGPQHGPDADAKHLVNLREGLLPNGVNLRNL